MITRTFDWVKVVRSGHLGWSRDGYGRNELINRNVCSGFVARQCSSRARHPGGLMVDLEKTHRHWYQVNFGSLLGDSKYAYCHLAVSNTAVLLSNFQISTSDFADVQCRKQHRMLSVFCAGPAIEKWGFPPSQLLPNLGPPLTLCLTHGGL